MLQSADSFQSEALQIAGVAKCIQEIFESETFKFSALVVKVIVSLFQ